jgi:hypothetical protein
VEISAGKPRLNQPRNDRFLNSSHNSKEVIKQDAVPIPPLDMGLVTAQFKQSEPPQNEKELSDENGQGSGSA